MHNFAVRGEGHDRRRFPSAPPSLSVGLPKRVPAFG